MIFGSVHYFLGMEIIKVPFGLIITQRKFSMEMIKNFEYDKLTATTYPMAPLLERLPNQDISVDATRYRKLVGKLNYLSNSRLNVAFLVQCLNQFLQSPTQAHMKAALHTV